MWRSSPKEWYEVGYWHTMGDGRTVLWVPLEKETRKQDIVIRYKTARQAELVLRRFRENGDFTKYLRLMNDEKPRVLYPPGGSDTVECACTVGAQECPVHPGNTKTQQEKIAYRKFWDARVKEEA